MASPARHFVLRRGSALRKPGLVAGALAAGALVLSGCAAPFEEPSDSTEEYTAPPVWTGSPAPAGHGEDDDHSEDSSEGPSRTVRTTLNSADGTSVGNVTISESADHLEIRVVVDADSEVLSPGFKGMHIHEFGVCEPDSEAPDGDSTGDFLSAGGHLQLEGATHSGTGMSGDLTSLYVLEDGTGELVTLTDRVTIDDLLIGEGTSIMIHEGPDNFGNIPERYTGGAEPDEQTRNTGDAGGRVACGVIQ
ncbi:superoxide dismutase family protein [Hoyosella sp. G463]|uniref:Superoxide dismutase [Cu-Zn] n=1 Tax=Lolliginicoccus lacisalsi TaxID=2742202 RepID=A0A927JDK3_9ACTN|nr:superoxide dismutase family protein [Lolliginicoccus lacisalsi]MBD8507384.1 superoxide dismutase family protein [Lolliginicoccus lacisalsi]